MRDHYGSIVASTSVVRSAAMLVLLRRGNTRMTVGQLSRRVSWKVGFVFVNYETNMLWQWNLSLSRTLWWGVCHGCLQGGLTVPPVGGDWNWRLGDCEGWSWKTNCPHLRSCHWSRSKCYCLTFSLTLLTQVIMYQPSLHVCASPDDISADFILYCTLSV